MIYVAYTQFASLLASFACFSSFNKNKIRNGFLSQHVSGKFKEQTSGLFR